MLRFYAQNFNAVELNVTFYRLPAAKSMEAMAKNTPERFRFVAKVNQGATHTKNLGEVRPACRAFLRCLAPLRGEGKLGAVVAQLPERARPTKQELDRLRYIADELRELRLLFEFRHARWATPKLKGLLKRLGAGFCCSDLPQLPRLMPRLQLAVGPVAMVRLHGRNAAAWAAKGGEKERYDYLYSAEELREWVSWVWSLAEQEDVYVFMNNCYSGKAVINARMFQALLRLEDELVA